MIGVYHIRIQNVKYMSLKIEFSLLFILFYYASYPNNYLTFMYKVRGNSKKKHSWGLAVKKMQTNAQHAFD